MLLLQFVIFKDISDYFCLIAFNLGCFFKTYNVEKQFLTLYLWLLMVTYGNRS